MALGHVLAVYGFIAFIFFYLFVHTERENLHYRAFFFLLAMLHILILLNVIIIYPQEMNITKTLYNNVSAFDGKEVTTTTVIPSNIWNVTVGYYKAVTVLLTLFALLIIIGLVKRSLQQRAREDYGDEI